MKRMTRYLALCPGLALGTAWAHEAPGLAQGHGHAGDTAGILLAALAAAAWLWWRRGR